MKPLTVIGLNCGTSMDGIDAAAFRISRGDAKLNGKTPRLKAEMLGSVLHLFEPEFSSHLKRFIASGKTSLDEICRLNFALGHLFADAALKLMGKLGLSAKSVDLIGSHGQTIWHAPSKGDLWGMQARGTLQLGEPAVIAARTGVPVIADFRVADMAVGGQGAPLTSFADEVLFGQTRKPLIVLNIGGIANMTVLDASGEAIMAFDTGPGNMLIDRAMEILCNKPFDEGGKFAATGEVHEAWLGKMLSQPYFSLPPPKTTGREMFGHPYARKLIEKAPPGILTSNIVATITALTAASIALNYERFVGPRLEVETIVLGGGGESNRTLTEMLKNFWPNKVELKRHEDFGISTKFKEALLFALLAYTNHFDIPNNVPSSTGASRKVRLGKLCKP